VLLNDPTYVEASRVLAERIIQSAGKNTGPHPDRVSPGVANGKRARRRCRSSRSCTNTPHSLRRQSRDAKKLLGVGFTPAAKDVAPVELRGVDVGGADDLNLHETITRN